MRHLILADARQRRVYVGLSEMGYWQTRDARIVASIWKARRRSSWREKELLRLWRCVCEV